MKVDVEPAAAHRWPDVVEAFGPRASSEDSCWCQRFRDPLEPTNRDALYREVRDAVVPVGLIAYLEGHPVGWSRVVPRSTLPGVVDNRALQRILDEDDAAWWITCVNLRREARGNGIGVALLKAAIRHARGHGASVLDGHPVDVEKLPSRPSPSALLTGTLSMFSAAGFREIGRTRPTRPVMRADLQHSGADDGPATGSFGRRAGSR